MTGGSQGLEDLVTHAKAVAAPSAVTADAPRVEAD
jgi:hypothetical protein